MSQILVRRQVYYPPGVRYCRRRCQAPKGPAQLQNHHTHPFFDRSRSVCFARSVTTTLRCRVRAKENRGPSHPNAAYALGTD